MVQTVTFRLAGSLPREIYESVVDAAKADQRRALIDHLIDEGRGSCLLADPRNARIVSDALSHFDGIRYGLLAWAVMPNHVHAMIEQYPGYPLGQIVHAWKSFTANRINGLSSLEGRLWAPDYYDCFIRDADHYVNAVDYVEHNPVKAGLAERADEWPFSSAGSGQSDAGWKPAVPACIDRRDRGHPGYRRNPAMSRQPACLPPPG